MTQTGSLLLLLCCSAVLRSLHAQPATTDTVVYSCTFEQDYETNKCGGITLINYADGFTWTWFSGSTPSLTTGPDWDHTLGPNVTTGHYMYTEATDFMPGDVAQLVLPSAATPSQESPLCLTFWRHMYGMHIGTMNVTQTFNGGEPTVLWSLSGNQNYSWDQQNVTLQPQGGSFGTVTFVGVRGGQDEGQPYGDEAIDDIYIYDGSCGASTSTAASTATSTTTATTTSTTTVPTTTTSTTMSTTTAAPTTTSTTMAAPTTTSTTMAASTTMSTTTAASTTTSTTIVPTTTTTTTTVQTTTTAASTQTSTDPTTVITANPMTTTAAAPQPLTPESLINDLSTGAENTATPQSTGAQSTGAQSTEAQSTGAQSTGMQSTGPSTSTSAPIQTTSALPDSTSVTSVSDSTTAAATSAPVTSSAAMSNTMTSSEVTSHPMTSQTSGSKATTMQGGATANAAAQSGSSTNAPGTLLGLTADKLIVIIAVLSALVLLLLIAVLLLACCLAVTRRDYHVERAANQYSSNSTLDNVESGGRK